MSIKDTSRGKYYYTWPRPAVTVDIALFTVEGLLNQLRLQVLLIERDAEPFAGAWALPGGFVREDEDLADAARRELAEETGLGDAYLEQVVAVGTPSRDPRGHTVTVVWAGLVPGDASALRAGGDARRACWTDVDALPRLAFDHAALLTLALSHLRRRIGEAPVCFELLPKTFTLSELQSLTEAILGRTVDRRNLRRKVQEMGLVEEAAGKRQEGAHRPAQLYRLRPGAFDPERRPERELPF